MLDFQVDAGDVLGFQFFDGSSIPYHLTGCTGADMHLIQSSPALVVGDAYDIWDIRNCRWYSLEVEIEGNKSVDKKYHNNEYLIQYTYVGCVTLYARW